MVSDKLWHEVVGIEDYGIRTILNTRAPHLADPEFNSSASWCEKKGYAGFSYDPVKARRGGFAK